MNTIDIEIDRGSQPDMFSGENQNISIKRECNLIKPTLFDYQREQELLKRLIGK